MQGHSFEMQNKQNNNCLVKVIVKNTNFTEEELKHIIDIVKPNLVIDYGMVIFNKTCILDHLSMKDKILQLYKNTTDYYDIEFHYDIITPDGYERENIPITNDRLKKAQNKKDIKYFYLQINREICCFYFEFKSIPQQSKHENNEINELKTQIKELKTTIDTTSNINIYDIVSMTIQQHRDKINNNNNEIKKCIDHKKKLEMTIAQLTDDNQKQKQLLDQIEIFKKLINSAQ